MSSCKDKPTTVQEVVQESTKIDKQSTDVKTPEKKTKKSILFFGDSLTAGYGLSEEESFPSLIQKRLDSLNLPYTVINAGLSGETTSGGVERIDWVLQQDVDIFVLELGANDMLRGLDIGMTKKNLETIIERVRAKNNDIEIIIAGMQAPPNMGQEYQNEFFKIFKDLSEDNGFGLIPFLLDGVAGIPNLNLPDGKHPNAKGQKIVVENVWATLESYVLASS